jgi:hypothetical protein
MSVSRTHSISVMVYLKKPGRITLKKEHMVLREQIFLFIFYFLLLLGARIFFSFYYYS